MEVSDSGVRRGVAQLGRTDIGGDDVVVVLRYLHSGLAIVGADIPGQGVVGGEGSELGEPTHWGRWASLARS